MYRLYGRPSDRMRELFSPTRHIYHKEVWALRNVDLEVEHGKALGIVGVNGAGKSTLLKLIAGGFSPTEGTVEVRGRISSILELGTGFQPHLTGRQNALVNALFLGQRPWEIEARLDEIIAFAELGQYANQPLSTYSSGMQARLAFAVLTLLNPEVLILDEALAAGDAGFAEKCKKFIRNLCRSGCTTLVTSHDLRFVEDVCDSAIWIHHGVIEKRGDPGDVVNSFREALGLKASTADDRARPRSLLLRFASVDGARSAEPFLLHEATWLGAEGETLASFHPGLENAFQTCLTTAADLGLMPGSARAGWGARIQNLGERGGVSRACRPDLGPGGAAYLAVPVPPAPFALPLRLRLNAYQSRGAPGVNVSLLANGRFQELGRLEPLAEPWWKQVTFDVAFAFSDEGAPAPPFDLNLVEGPARPAVAS